MKRLISFFPTIRLRQILTVFLAGMAFWVSAAFGYDTQLQANAEPVTPEATSYQVNHNDKGSEAQDQLKNPIENIKEKLNLDEPLPRSTKEFLNDVQGKTDNAVGDTVNNTQKGLNDAAKSVNSR